MNIPLARGDVATALDAARQVSATDQLMSYSCDLATATGAAYAWAGQADEARRALRLAAEKAAAERVQDGARPGPRVPGHRGVRDGSAASAQSAACTAVDTARRFGLAAYHGVAPAYAIRARTGEDPASRSRGRDARTEPGQTGVHRSCARLRPDGLRRHAHRPGRCRRRAAPRRGPVRLRPLPRPRHRRSLPGAYRIPPWRRRGARRSTWPCSSSN